MTFIKNTVAYKIKSTISQNDYFPITVGDNDVDGFVTGQTANIKMVDLSTYIASGLTPEIGGTQKITEIIYEGELTDVVVVINQLSPIYSVARYEDLYIDINGNKYILKLQNTTIGIGQTAITSDDLISISAAIPTYFVESVNVSEGETHLAFDNTDPQNPKGSISGLATTSQALYEAIPIVCGDISTNITTGTIKAYLPMPFNGIIVGVKANVRVAQASGSILTFDINKNGTSILSTKLTIDNTETTSLSAAIQPVISDDSLGIDSIITIDVDQIGTAGAKTPIITLLVTRQ